MPESSPPLRGEVVRVRQRHYLAGDVHPIGGPHTSTRVDLACLDDDAAGESLSVLWELEPDAQVLREASSRRPRSRESSSGVFRARLMA